MSYFRSSSDEPNRWLLRRYALQASLNDLLPVSRPAFACLKVPLVPSSRPKLFSFETENGDRKRVAYVGLQSCSNTWLCSHCAPYLSEKRRLELERAVKCWRGPRYAVSRNSPGYADLPGCEVRFVTFTVPHLCSDSLVSLLTRFKDAFRHMTNRWLYRRFLSDFTVVGSVNLFEVTYGKNGWHPHAHVLYFMDTQLLDDDVLKTRLFGLWSAAAVKLGFSEPSPAAFFVGDGDFVSNYVTKYGREPKRPWTVGHEMSRWFLKTSRRGFSPFELLEANIVKRCSEEDGVDLDKDFLFEAGERFIEFASAFKGRHQLRWTRGLKQQFGLKDVSDEQLLAQREQSYLKDKTARELAVFSGSQWEDVLRKGMRFSLIKQYLDASRLGGSN